MHCPENVNGGEYVELVAAVSLLLSRNLSGLQTFMLADFLQAVSTQLYTLAAFKEAERIRAEKQRADGPKGKREGPSVSGPPPHV